MSNFKFQDDAPEEPSVESPTPPAPPAPAPVPPAPAAPSPQAPTPHVVSQPPTPQAQPATPSAARPAAPTGVAPQPSVPQQGALRPVPPAGVAPRPVAPQVPSPQMPSQTTQPQAAPRQVPSPQVPPVAPQVPRPASGNPGQQATQTRAEQGRGPAPMSGSARPAAGSAVPSPQVPSPQVPVAPKVAPSPPLPNMGTTTAAQAAINRASAVSRPATPTIASPRSQPKSAGDWGRQLLDKLDTPASWLFRVAAVAGGIALLMMILGLAGMHNATLAAPGTLEKGQVIVLAQRMQMAATVLNWALIGMALSLVVVSFDVKGLGLGIAGLGLALFFGCAPLFALLIGKTALAAKLTNTLRPAVIALTGIGLAKYAFDLAVWVTALPERMRGRADVGVSQQAEVAQQRVARDANMFSPCWKLPFCREVVRKQCPAYLAKKTCWKFGRGCYCDEEMISRIIRGESLEVIKAPTRLSRQGKPPCGRCYIFLEHQTHKFRMISPLTLPITIISMVIAWPFYVMAFQAGSKFLEPLWRGLSFTSAQDIAGSAFNNTDPSNYNYGKIDPQQVALFAQNLLGVFVGFFLLIYIARFMEWAIYKARW